jgi:hypothetical protein
MEFPVILITPISGEAKKDRNSFSSALDICRYFATLFLSMDGVLPINPYNTINRPYPAKPYLSVSNTILGCSLSVMLCRNFIFASAFSIGGLCGGAYSFFCFLLAALWPRKGLEGFSLFGPTAQKDRSEAQPRKARFFAALPQKMRPFFFAASSRGSLLSGARAGFPSWFGWRRASDFL